MNMGKKKSSRSFLVHITSNLLLKGQVKKEMLRMGYPHILPFQVSIQMPLPQKHVILATLFNSDPFPQTQLITLKIYLALVRWLSWLEHYPIHQKDAGSIPSQGTYLACKFNPWLGAYERQLTNVSLSSMFLYLPLSSL